MTNHPEWCLLCYYARGLCRDESSVEPSPDCIARDNICATTDAWHSRVKS